ncbi:MAG: hypothetical protein CO189_05465 [candidate division Zixibacteria bacterium CG_4_9_14_3_um_filter_46_8]|nr:MAG: hypothetical protein CO189_05465 [candidate division Zixibacteria bacterium CG_4_9_14_3_um_filter_46_8]
MKKMLMLSVLCGIVLGSTTLVGAAAGDIQWTRTYGGSSESGARSVQQTTDGGYIIAGYTYSFGAGSDDFYLVKTDSSGNMEWDHRYGGTNIDQAFSVVQTADEGYIMAGITWSFGEGNTDFYLIKTNEYGGAQWGRTYGGLNGDDAKSVLQTADGGFIVAGYRVIPGFSQYQFYLVRTNDIGDTIWTRTYGWQFRNDQAYSIELTSDGGFIVAGVTDNNNADFYVVKTDSVGDTLWTRTYGGAGIDVARSINQTNDGGYLIGGYTTSYGGGANDVYLIKLNSNGDTIWTGTYGGTDNDYGCSVKETMDGDYIVSGYTSSFGAGLKDAYLLKIHPNGDLNWSRTYGGIYDDYCYSVGQTNDSGFIIAGATDTLGAGGYEFYLVKIEGDQSPPSCCDVNMTPDTSPVIVPPGGSFGLAGNVGNPTADPIQTDVWIGVIYNNIFYQLWLFDNIPLNPGQYLAAHLNQAVPNYAPPGTYTYVAYCGDHNTNKCDSFSFPFTVTGARIDSGADEWTLEGGWNNATVPAEYELVGSYPNPFNASTTIEYQLPYDSNVKLEIFNLRGQKVATLVDANISAGNHQVTWDASQYSSGIYFYRLVVGEKTFAQRMTLLK